MARLFVHRTLDFLLDVDFDCPITLGSAALADVRLALIAPHHARITPQVTSYLIEPLAGPVATHGRGQLHHPTEVIPPERLHLGPYRVDLDPRYSPPTPAPVRLVIRGGRSPHVEQFPPGLQEFHAAPTTATDVPALPARYEATDEMEVRLVEALRANPADELARNVYADWLEQHGGGLRAEFLRAERTVGELDVVDRLRELAVVHDVGWRALVSQARIEGCPRATCPGRWSALATIGDDDLARTCGTCDQRVHYCGSLPEARLRRDEPIAIDAALDRDHVLRARVI